MAKVELTSKEITLSMLRSNLYSAVVCDALDELGLRSQAVSAQLLPRTGSHRLVGRCRTTLWADTDRKLENPYELELVAVDSCEPDDVMIAAAGGSLRSGIWGELLTTAAKHRGCVGAIVDGAVRDVAAMTAMNFPVFSRATCPYDSKDRQHVIDLNLPVNIAEVRFRPGDLVFADEDGIVVVPSEIEEDVVRRAWSKVHAENLTRQSIRNGMRMAEAYERYGVL